MFGKHPSGHGKFDITTIIDCWITDHPEANTLHKMLSMSFNNALLF
jgi:hypothetical protein